MISARNDWGKVVALATSVVNALLEVGVQRGSFSGGLRWARGGRQAGAGIEPDHAAGCSSHVALAANRNWRKSGQALAAFGLATAIWCSGGDRLGLCGRRCRLRRRSWCRSDAGRKRRGGCWCCRDGHSLLGYANRRVCHPKFNFALVDFAVDEVQYPWDVSAICELHRGDD